MWKNMTWLAAEWRYYFEWRKLAMAARLEGRDAPQKNSPFWYTFRWVGVAVVCPITVFTSLGFLVSFLVEANLVMQVVKEAAVVLSIIVLVGWIIYSLGEMADKGPHWSVVDRWKQTHAAVDKKQ